MEIYIAYKDYQWMMKLTEEMIKKWLLIFMGKQRFFMKVKQLILILRIRGLRCWMQ